MPEMSEGSDREQAPDIAPGAAHSRTGAHNVFISYASSDSAVANSLCAALEREGMKCWIAPRDVAPGEIYAESIVHAIDAARLVVLVLSQNAAVSPHVLREVERASSKRHPVLSLRVDLTPVPAALEYFLNTSQWLDASAIGVDRALPKLVEAVQRSITHESVAATDHSGGATRPAARTGPAGAARRRSPWGLIAAVLLVSAALLAAVIGWWLVHLRGAAPAQSAGPITSLAVLPFKNYSGDPNQEYFADGMTDLLTTELGGIGALTVKSHQSSLKFKDSTKSMPEIGQELHADAVIQGSMLRDGNHITVNVQLIEAPTDRHLWAKKFEGDVTNIFKMRNEVVEAIAREIKKTISPEQSSRLSSARAVDPAALQEYLLGRQSWNRQTEKGLAEALEHFNRAKEIDPDFALAWAGVANYYWGAAPDIAPPEEVAKGIAAARRAVELDDSLAEAHTALAMLNYAVDYEWGESEREIQRAIRLNSNSADAHWQYGWLLVYVGRFDEAVKEMQRAVELDPLSAVFTTDLSAPYTMKKDYDKAIAQCRKALELDPSYFVSHFVLGWIEMHRGANYSKAIEEFHLVQTIETQPMATGLLGYAYARIGQKDKAMETLNELNQLASRRFVSPYHQALVYLGLGENSQAIDWLEKAYEERSPWLDWLKVEPMFDPLRSVPRFQALYKKMNFPP
jgi:TolB-like protein